MIKFMCHKTAFIVVFFLLAVCGHPCCADLTEGAAKLKSTQLACAALLDGSVTLDRHTRANFLSVTVPNQEIPISLLTYTLDFILNNLGIEKSDLPKTFAGKKVLLVGEGFGELLPALIEAGAAVVAVDPLYAFVGQKDFSTAGVDSSNQTMLKHIQSFFDRYSAWLKAGVADRLPFENDTFDFHITHLVYNNFLTPKGDTDTLAILKAVHESIRTLARGGQSISVLNGNLTMLNRIADDLEVLENRELISGFAVDNLGRKQTQMTAANGPNIHNMHGHQLNLARMTINK